VDISSYVHYQKSHKKTLDKICCISKGISLELNILNDILTKIIIILESKQEQEQEKEDEEEAVT
jgi:hypothetical protein